MSPIASGLRRHEVTVQTVAAVANADSGFDEMPTTLAIVRASIDSASQRQLERVTSGTVIGEATHLVTIPYIPNVTTQTRIIFGSRTFHVLSVTNPREENRELQLVCMEVGI